jgi:DNA-binding NtrC family response regulator
LSQPWPGNQRELENVIERSLLFARASVIDTIALPAPSPQTESVDDAGGLRALRHRAAREAENKAIVEALKECNGKVSLAARAMGISSRAVHMRLKLLGIRASDYRLAAIAGRRAEF